MLIILFKFNSKIFVLHKHIICIHIDVYGFLVAFLYTHDYVNMYMCIYLNMFNTKSINRKMAYWYKWWYYYGKIKRYSRSIFCYVIYIYFWYDSFYYQFGVLNFIIRFKWHAYFYMFLNFLNNYCIIIISIYNKLWLLLIFYKYWKLPRI